MPPCRGCRSHSGYNRFSDVCGFGCNPNPTRPCINPRRPHGEVIRSNRNFHLDKIDPKSKDGSNQITNRAPLCPHHNLRKGSQRVHLSDYHKQIADAGEMMVDTMDDLIDLSQAYQSALDIYTRESVRRNPQVALTRS